VRGKGLHIFWPYILEDDDPGPSSNHDHVDVRYSLGYISIDAILRLSLWILSPFAGRYAHELPTTCFSSLQVRCCMKDLTQKSPNNAAIVPIRTPSKPTNQYARRCIIQRSMSEKRKPQKRERRVSTSCTCMCRPLTPCWTSSSSSCASPPWQESPPQAHAYVWRTWT